MNTEYLYGILKLLHLGALLLWIGPTLGGWWLLRCANHRFGEPGMVSQYLYSVFLKLLWLEHAALVVLLGSGLAMAFLYDWIGADWLYYKLILVVLVILPLELVDIWVGHRKLPALFNGRHPSRPYSRRESRLLNFYHRLFTPLALLLMPPGTAAIMWLAITKIS